MKLKVAVDLDDTLALTIQGTLAFVSERLGKDLAHGDITAIEYWADYGVSDTDAIALVQSYNTAGFPGLQPVPGARAVLEGLADRCEFYVVTAREAATEQATKAWIGKFFPGIFTDVIFAGNPFVNTSARSKEAVCKELGIAVVIDDSISHVKACASRGMHALLFGGHPWHPEQSSGPRIHHTKTWRQVGEYFDTHYKGTIAVDLDDVLSASAPGLIEYSNKTWGHTLTVDAYHEDWYAMWGVSAEEGKRRNHLLHTNPTYLEQSLPISRALATLQKLSRHYRLIILTSRRMMLKEITHSWLAKHFPDVFSEVVFAGIWDNDGYEESGGRLNRTKAETCQRIGANYLIDDQLKHCLGAAEVGVTCLLFGDYNWNRTEQALPNSVVRVKDWKEVEEYFDAKS